MGTMILFCHLPTEVAMRKSFCDAGDLQFNLSDTRLAQLHNLHLVDVAAPFVGLRWPPEGVTGADAKRLMLEGATWDDAIIALAFLADRVELEKRGARALLQARAPHLLPRWEAGVLPSDELLHQAREFAFSTLGGWSRYVRMSRRDVRHRSHCVASTEYSSSDNPTMTEPTFKAMQAMARDAESVDFGCLAEFYSAITLTPRRHMASCGCGESAVKLSVLASVTWCGRVLTREYALS